MSTNNEAKEAIQRRLNLHKQDIKDWFEIIKTGNRPDSHILELARAIKDAQVKVAELEEVLKTCF